MSSDTETLKEAAVKQQAITRQMVEPVLKAQEKIYEAQYENLKNLMGYLDMCDSRICTPADFYRESLNSMIAVGNAGFNIFQQMNAELVKYCSRFIDDYAECVKEVVTCRSLPDAIGLQSGFMQHAAGKVFDEAKKLSDIYLTECGTPEEKCKRSTFEASKKLAEALEA